MKKIVFVILLLSSLNTYAQDTTKVEQYCQVTAQGRLFSNKVTIDVDFGEERSIWKDHRLKDEEGKIKKFNTTVDALNYLGKLGWKLVNAYPVTNTNGTTFYQYLFKRVFAKSDVD